MGKELKGALTQIIGVSKEAGSYLEAQYLSCKVRYLTTSQENWEGTQPDQQVPDAEDSARDAIHCCPEQQDSQTSMCCKPGLPSSNPP